MASTTTESTSSMVTTTLQYAAIAALGYGVYYSRQRSNSRQPPPPAARPVADPEPRTEKRAKKQRAEQHAQEASSQKKKAASKAQPKVSELPKKSAPVEENSADDDDLDNREFARQLASLKEGKKFTAKTGSEKKKQKSVKQSQAQVHEPAKKAVVSPPSSTGGVDADDDQSPPVSPQVVAANGSGVDDMLEASAPGPSTLRIVPSDTSRPQKAKSQKPAPEAALSKKQRQRKQKAEASRAEAEEAESVRKGLMEKQRRLARISEGRAAKDGSQSKAATNGNNAWSASKPNGVDAGQHSADTSAAPLLDTFAEPTRAAAPKQAPAPAKADTWTSTLPSEEKQLELLKSETETDEWNTVTSKKAKKGSTTSDERAEDSAASIPKKAAKASQPAAQAKTTSAPVTNGRPAVTKGYGTYSALNVEEPEEEEQEWDV